MANDTTPESEETNPPSAWRGASPEIAGATHVGVVRRINQDAFGRFDDPARREILLVVADGLGGHRGGEVASRMAVERIGAALVDPPDPPTPPGRGGDVGTDRPARLRSAIEDASAAILAASRKDRTLDGMGTTIVAFLLAEEGESFVAHVGDSRLYRLREEAIEALTEDHSLVATLVREGVLEPEAAREDPRRNQILRALGVREDVEVEVAPVDRRPGDRFLLCSDGLHGMIEDDAVRGIVLGQESVATRVEALIEAANAAGGTDNVTCLLAELPSETGGPLRRTASRWIASTRAALRGASPSDATGRDESE